MDNNIKAGLEVYQTLIQAIKDYNNKLKLLGYKELSKGEYESYQTYYVHSKYLKIVNSNFKDPSYNSSSYPILDRIGIALDLSVNSMPEGIVLPYFYKKDLIQ